MHAQFVGIRARVYQCTEQVRHALQLSKRSLARDKAERLARGRHVLGLQAMDGLRNKRRTEQMLKSQPVMGLAAGPISLAGW